MTTSSAPTAPEARILVVDDEHDNRELLAIVLRWDGFTVVTAESGDEALAIVRLQLPDLVLLDIMMPGMTGYDVVATMKADPSTAHIPVIIVSALAGSSVRKQALAAGADDFLPKPVVRGELLPRVRAAIRKSLVEGSASGPVQVEIAKRLRA